MKPTDLDEHEPLHGLIPLQQDDPGLQRSTQILVARVRVSHCEAEKDCQEVETGGAVQVRFISARRKVKGDVHGAKMFFFGLI